MSGPEGSEKPVIQRLMHLTFPNETPDDQILATAREIADHLFVDAAIGEDSLIVIGTIAWLDISMTGERAPKPEDQLSPEELRLSMLVLEHYESIE